jgi:endonuclease YncB( thermonuclease family)
MRYSSILRWVVSCALGTSVAAQEGKTHNAVEGALRRDTIKGGIAHSPADYLRVTGRPRVIDGNTIVFEDGVEFDVSGGMDAPALEQMGLLGDKFYPCGKDAAEFLRALIGDKQVTFFVNTRYGMNTGRGNRMRGICYVGETRVDDAMIRAGWAVADHSSTVGAELIARENKRGLWRGKFVAPKNWREGERLPGEPASGGPVAGVRAPEPNRPAEPPTVVKDGPTVVKITGRVKVLDAHTLRYEDGTELELNGGMDAPDRRQQFLIGDKFYPWGEDAAEFLEALIGERPVMCHVEGQRGVRLHGACFVGETCLEIEMVRNGWALSHHTGMDGWAMIAQENHRGAWRGKFIEPERWRKGERLPGEPR